MEYILKLFDIELIKFNIIENLADPVLQITCKVRTERQQTYGCYIGLQRFIIK